MTRLLLIAAMTVTACGVAVAQAPISVAVPAGAQTNPTGFATISSTTDDFWMGDRNLGFRHYIRNPAVPGQWMLDPDHDFSVGGPETNNLPFSYVGQIAQVNSTLAFLASPDPQKPKQGFVRGAGLWVQQFALGNTPPVSSVGSTSPETITKGIAGDLPTAAAFGPDGKLYYGGLGNPNLRRLTNPTGDVNTQAVETFGTAANGQHVLSLSFNGGDLYVATGDGFYVVPNVAACNGNQNNCGRPQLILGGAVVATAVDQLGNIYFAFAQGIVERFKPSTQTLTTVASGLSFGAGVTAGLGVDQQGNLFIGQISEIDVITASDLLALGQ